MERKVALVTGGSRGIGKSIVITLAQAGVDVAVAYRLREAEAAQVVREISPGSARRSLLVQGDVADPSDCQNMVNKLLDHFGRIDILVNNAGIRADNLLVRMKEKEWDSVLRTNLSGVYHCTRAVIRPMLKQKQGGRIINIASIAEIYGNIGQVNYAAAKAGVIGFTRSLAKELGGRGITVNAVAPGFIETEMTADLPENLKEEVLARIPLGRMGKPADVAEVVKFLALDGRYITGQVILVDGGLVM